jgi:hypothetical protein
MTTACDRAYYLIFFCFTHTFVGRNVLNLTLTSTSELHSFLIEHVPRNYLASVLPRPS